MTSNPAPSCVDTDHRARNSDALLVDATLNTLSVLIRTRPSTANRILNTVLNFNPLKLANSPMTPKTKVLIRSMEKTTRMLLFHLLKRWVSNHRHHWSMIADSDQGRYKSHDTTDTDAP